MLRIRSVSSGNDRCHAIIEVRQIKQWHSQLFADRPAVGSIEVGHINYSPLLQRTPAATEAMYLMMRSTPFDLGYRRYRVEVRCP